MCWYIEVIRSTCSTVLNTACRPLSVASLGHVYNCKQQIINFANLRSWNGVNIAVLRYYNKISSWLMMLSSVHFHPDSRYQMVYISFRLLLRCGVSQRVRTRLVPASLAVLVVSVAKQTFVFPSGRLPSRLFHASLVLLPDTLTFPRALRLHPASAWRVGVHELPKTALLPAVRATRRRWRHLSAAARLRASRSFC